MPNAKDVSDLSSSVDLVRRFKLIPEVDFAELRGVDNRALSNERSQGKGPAFLRVGRQIYYTLGEIEKYLAACTVKPTRTPTLVDGVSRRRKSGAKA